MKYRCDLSILAKPSSLAVCQDVEDHMTMTTTISSSSGAGYNEARKGYVIKS